MNAIEHSRRVLLQKKERGRDSESASTEEENTSRLGSRSYRREMVTHTECNVRACLLPCWVSHTQTDLQDAQTATLNSESLTDCQ